MRTAEEAGFLRGAFGWGTEAARSSSHTDCLLTRETLRGASEEELRRARFLEVSMVAGEEVLEVCSSSPTVCRIDGGRFPATVGWEELVVAEEEAEGGVIVEDGGRLL